MNDAINFNKKKVIRSAALFQGVGDGVIDDLATHCHEKAVPKGAQLFSAGDVAHHFFIILDGWIKLYRISREGEETIIHIFGPGESFAEAAVFSDRKMYPVNAQAIEDTVVIEVPRDFFLRQIEKDSTFALRILGAISSRQHYLVQQLEQVTTRTAPQRIGAFLLHFCKHRPHGSDGSLVVNLPYDKAVISTRLNIKPETFSRALAKLEPYGIAAQGRKIVIHDPTALADFCDVDWWGKPC